MTDITAATYCANHPRTETSLRCNRCEKPICSKCAIKTPTGYRCSECVRGQQKVFETAQWYDYLSGIALAGLISLIVSGLLSFISGMMGFFFWFIMIAAAPSAGMVIAEAVRWVTRKRRAKRLFLIVAIGVVLGALPMILVDLFVLNIYDLIVQGLYLVLVVPSVYYRLSGIRLFK